MFIAILTTFVLLIICTLPVWKLTEILLKKFTNVNIKLVWVQILIDIPSILIGYKIADFLVELYAKHLGIEQ